MFNSNMIWFRYIFYLLFLGFFMLLGYKDQEKKIDLYLVI